MDYHRIPQIAQQLGYQDQELMTLLMHMKPNPMICREGIMLANIYRVIETLDINGIAIPNDSRRSTRTQEGVAGPLLPARQVQRIAMRQSRRKEADGVVMPVQQETESDEMEKDGDGQTEMPMKSERRRGRRE